MKTTKTIVSVDNLDEVEGIGQSTIEKIKAHFGGEVSIEVPAEKQEEKQEQESKEDLLFQKRFSDTIGEYTYVSVEVYRKAEILEGVLKSKNGKFIRFYEKEGVISKSYSFYKSQLEKKCMVWIKSALDKAKQNL